MTQSKAICPISALKVVGLEVAKSKHALVLRPDVRLCKDGKIRAKGNARTKTHDEIVAKFWNGVDKKGPNECWEWIRGKTSSDPSRAYGLFSANGSVIATHRFSYELHYGPIPNNMLVCHHCDNPPCVNPIHLFLGDERANALDYVAKGRFKMGHITHPESVPRGERHGMSKLTDVNVLDIRRHSTINRQALAKRFGVSISAIKFIRSRQTWKHL